MPTTLPKLITATTWGSVWSSLWSQAIRSSGSLVEDGAVVPKWTNREALAVVVALRGVATRGGTGFPLWYQFAAAAYGWEPDRDALDVTSDQANRIYEVSGMLADEAKRIMRELDTARVADPRIELVDVWSGAGVEGAVQYDLSADGARFKVPLPVCKDRNGRPAKPVRDPVTGKWSCPHGVVEIDPISAILKDLSRLAAPLAVVLLVGALLAKPKTRRGRKRK